MNTGTVEQTVAASKMETLVGAVVRALVQDTEAVTTVTRFEDGRCEVTVSVAAEDVGKVIGKQGRTVRALRTIVMSAGRQAGILCELVIKPYGTDEKEQS